MSRTNSAEAIARRKKREKEFGTKLKIRKLQTKNKRGRVTSTTSKKMSNIAGDTANRLRAESMTSTIKGANKGKLSTLGKGYKKSEKGLSDKATKRTAEISKARYPKMGTYKGKGKTTDTKTSTTTAKRGKSSIEAKNRARLGDARVDKLKAKNKDFQAMKKGKMTKAQFIEKYPNSQTAKKARMK